MYCKKVNNIKIYDILITGDEDMELLTQILNCKSDEEVDVIITEAINKMNSSTQPIEQLGFLDYGKTVNYYKGFIPLNTRIKYDSMGMETYGMESTDFFYDFAHFVRKKRINNKSSIIFSVETFINQYFGLPGIIDRKTIFDDKAWNSTTTDEEYFEALQNNKLGDLKGKGAAECTERAALAQQLLSLFGTEVYYCMGCVDLGDRQEGHCFNIVRRKKDYALLDYSVPITSYNDNGSVNAYYPFVGELSNEEFLDFINNGMLKSFENYQYVGKQKQTLSSSRQYVIGAYTIEKGKTM